MLRRDYYMYPAILDYLSDGDVQLIFPDFKDEMEKKDVFIGRWATNDDKIHEIAASYLFELIHNRIQGCDERYDEDDLPKPTSIRNLRLKEGQRSILVIAPRISYGCDGLHLYSGSDDSRLRFGPRAWWTREEKNDSAWIADEEDGSQTTIEKILKTLKLLLKKMNI